MPNQESQLKKSFKVFTEELDKASACLGLAHIRKIVCDYMPEGSGAEDGVQACFYYDRDQSSCVVHYNPNANDDPAYDAWHEMAELALVDLEEFAKECAKKKKFDPRKWEHLAHAMVQRIVCAARPDLVHMVEHKDGVPVPRKK